MKFFTINKISQKAFVREKRWLFYFLSSVSILANLLDIAYIRMDTSNPIFYINCCYILIIIILMGLRLMRKVTIHFAAAVVVYLIVLNLSATQFSGYGEINYAEEFLRESLYIWMTTLIAGFLINRNHVLIIETWHLALLIMAVSEGSPFIVDNQIMLFLAITIFAAFMYYVIYLLDKNYIEHRILFERVHHDRLQLRKQEKKLLREDETKNRLFSIISHDLKSNSNLLLNFSILLQKRIYQKEYSSAEKMCDAIYQAADNNHNLLVNLLEWTRAQSETIEFRPTLVDIDSILTEIKSSFNQILQTKHITLISNNTITSPVVADGTMLCSIIRNLVSNAIKFSSIHTSVSIDVCTSGTSAMFKVTDSGHGMSQEKVSQLIDNGIVSSTRGTSDEKGSGLGFSICRYFIEKHHGTFAVNSIEGKGTEVIFTIPQH